MAQCAASNTTTRTRRVLHRLFPSRRFVVATVTLEIASFLLGVPLPLHVVLVLVAHLIIVFL